MTTMRTRAAAGLVSVAAAFGMILATAGGASAFTEKNGVLESDEMGFYYNSGQGGCVFDVYDHDIDFSNDRFKGNGCSGFGQSTNDNTASYRNRDLFTYYVHIHANYGGLTGSIPPGYVGNASADYKNQISSTSS